MDLLKAFYLGILEGLTEFIPVSSTGHLIILSHYMGLEGPKADTFDVFIQLGAILAVVFLYPRRFLGLLDFKSGSNNGFKGKHGLLKLFVACLPAFILGALLHKSIKQYLFTPTVVAAALIGGGLVMLWIERRATYKVRVSEVEDLSLRDCVLVGLFQCFALWPGMSRSGSTIIGAMLIGCDRKAAAEFSFLLAVPVMTAAVLYDLLKSFQYLESSDLEAFSLGFIVSFIVAIVAIRFFIALLGRYTLRPFGYYRIVLGSLVFLLL